MILLPHNSWEIKTTQKKGRGIFATKDITPGTVIGDYIGQVLRTAEVDTVEKEEGLYLMYYHDYASLYPTDINQPGIHLANHSCAPNCWMYIYKGHTLFFSLRHIFKGEELTISYLLPPDPFCNPCQHRCHCESKQCVGTMHLHEDQFLRWQAFSQTQAKQTKRKRIYYGKELAKLSDYTTSIADNPIYPLIGFSEKTSVSLPDTHLPSVAKLRTLVRETGRTLAFPKLATTIIGIQDDLVLSK